MSLRSLSFSLSLSKVVTEQSAQNVMIFSPKKKEAKRQTRDFFNDKKKCHVCCFFSSFAVPLTTMIFTRNTTNNTNETEERNENETRVRTMKKSIYFVRVRVCAETVLCYSFHKQGRIFFAGFLVSRECRILVKFDIIRISPRGERARFAPNSKRNLRNVLDPVKRFFPRRWRL